MLRKRNFCRSKEGLLTVICLEGAYVSRIARREHTVHRVCSRVAAMESKGHFRFMHIFCD